MSDVIVLIAKHVELSLGDDVLNMFFSSLSYCQLVGQKFSCFYFLNCFINIPYTLTQFLLVVQNFMKYVLSKFNEFFGFNPFVQASRDIIHANLEPVNFWM
jgi:hypothetical protein